MGVARGSVDFLVFLATPGPSGNSPELNSDLHSQDICQSAVGAIHSRNTVLFVPGNTLARREPSPSILSCDMVLLPAKQKKWKLAWNRSKDTQVVCSHPSFRALSGRLKSTARRDKFNQDSLSPSIRVESGPIVRST